MTALKKLAGFAALSLLLAGGALAQTSSLEGDVKGPDGKPLKDALIKLEERANRLPALMTIPMILFILPALFLVIAGPAVLRLIDAYGQ